MSKLTAAGWWVLLGLAVITLTLWIDSIVGDSDAPRAAETSVDATVAAATVRESQQPSALPTAPRGEAGDGAAVGWEAAVAPSAIPIPPEVVFLETQVDLYVGLMLMDEQIFGLTLYVSGRVEWSRQAVPVAGCESTNGAKRLKRESNGTISVGLFHINSVHAWRFDMLRLVWDDVYNTRAALTLHDEAGGWGPWAVCGP